MGKPAKPFPLDHEVDFVWLTLDWAERVLLPKDFFGCWTWDGTYRREYGVMTVAGSKYAAHRVAWWLFMEEDPGDMVVMHECDNPACVNPGHLRLGTQRENMQQAHAKGRIRPGGATKSRCKRGHEFTKENTYVAPHGARQCRKCVRLVKNADKFQKLLDSIKESEETVEV